ncbi:hypothetical protein EIP91_007948 [Steccherinum ochraceum]|uniref:Uncharacterized protein n=1 Tax=Steccherinum ochraceum TaxID=92696 RepID=A0A4R0RHJ3_9APHY|nr:hypothetical protein EIP91_007948 [Steccherinum ochraceum]
MSLTSHITGEALQRTLEAVSTQFESRNKGVGSNCAGSLSIYILYECTETTSRPLYSPRRAPFTGCWLRRHFRRLIDSSYDSACYMIGCSANCTSKTSNATDLSATKANSGPFRRGYFLDVQLTFEFPRIYSMMFMEKHATAMKSLRLGTFSLIRTSCKFLKSHATSVLEEWSCLG